MMGVNSFNTQKIPLSWFAAPPTLTPDDLKNAELVVTAGYQFSKDFLQKISAIALKIKPQELVYVRCEYGVTTCFIAASEKHVFVAFGLKEQFRGGAFTKITKATGLFFKWNGPQLKLERRTDVVKHTTNFYDRTSVDKIQPILKRAHKRSQAAIDLKDCPYVAQVLAMGLHHGRAGAKMVMFFPEYHGDFIAFNNHLVAMRSSENFKESSSLNIKHNIIKVALDFSRALKFIHSKGYIHRDLKADNLLVDWEACSEDCPKILRLNLTDFDLAYKTGDGREELDRLIGVPDFSPPEVLCIKLDFMDYLTLLGVDNLNDLLSPAIDTWYLGSILHHLKYRCFHPCNELLENFLSLESKSRQPFSFNPEIDNQRLIYQKKIVEAKAAWKKTVSEMIEEKNPDKDIVADPMAYFIWKLLRADPRKRPSDEEIENFIEPYAKAHGVT